MCGRASGNQTARLLAGCCRHVEAAEFLHVNCCAASLLGVQAVRCQRLGSARTTSSPAAACLSTQQRQQHSASSAEQAIATRCGMKFRTGAAHTCCPYSSELSQQTTAGSPSQTCSVCGPDYVCAALPAAAAATILPSLPVCCSLATAWSRSGVRATCTSSCAALRSLPLPAPQSPLWARARQHSTGRASWATSSPLSSSSTPSQQAWR